jgi:hypothetical protein
LFVVSIGAGRRIYFSPINNSRALNKNMVEGQSSKLIRKLLKQRH